MCGVGRREVSYRISDHFLQCGDVFFSEKNLRSKAVLDSQQTKKYTEALERFDPMIASAVRQLAMSALAKVEDGADSLTDGEARDWVRERSLDYAVEFRARTGIEFDPNIVVDKILDGAIAEARRSWQNARPVR